MTPLIIFKTQLLSSLWLCLVLSAMLPTPSLGFASWLKCFVELDPEEVIMWQKVVPSENARHPVSIEVQPLGIGTTSSDDDAVAWLKIEGNGKETQELQLPASGPGDPLTARVRLSVPDELQNQEVQFVVEFQTSAADAAAEAVEFIGRGVLCDGKRAFSRSHSEYVILQIDTQVLPNLEYVNLVAGWAPGMEAVSLTPILKLIPAKPAAGDGDGEL